MLWSCRILLRGRGRNKAILTSMFLFITVMFVTRDQPGLNEIALLRNFTTAPRMQLVNHRELVPQMTHWINQSSECSLKKSDFVYIKMIKCASETLSSVFRRFAYVHNRSVVLPVGSKLYIGWPHQIQPDFYRRNKTKEFNIMVDHAIYNHTTLSRIMSPRTVYITSLREPYSQFRSMFNYYNLREVTKMHPSVRDPMSEYLHRLDFYEARYTARDAKKRHCVPSGLHMSKNLMAFNLGFPTGFPRGTPDRSNETRLVKKWLKSLEREFLLVLIVEYIDESLVLLKRLMCWNMADILNYKRNSGRYLTYRDTVSSEDYYIYQNWSRVDFMLYEHFRKIFWQKVDNEGPDFMDEVAHFKLVNAQVSHYCENIQRKPEPLFIRESTWNKAFIYTANDCKLLMNRLSELLASRYDSQFPNITQPKPTLPFC